MQKPDFEPLSKIGMSSWLEHKSRILDYLSSKSVRYLADPTYKIPKDMSNEILEDPPVAPNPPSPPVDDDDSLYQGSSSLYLQEYKVWEARHKQYLVQRDSFLLQEKQWLS
jgi:hypothetical protein